MTHLSVPSFWRMNKAKYGLVGAKCSACGELMFPPRAGCIKCSSDKLTEEKMPNSGQILTWTTIHVSPDGFEAPYTVALVRLENGVVVPGQIVGDLNGLKINAAVRATFRRLNETKDGLILYGFKFEIV